LPVPSRRFPATNGASVVRDPTADEALAAVSIRDVRDLVLACHGEYRPDDPAASRLRIAGGLSLATL
jgi:hypothetical protein